MISAQSPMLRHVAFLDSMERGDAFPERSLAGWFVLRLADWWIEFDGAGSGEHAGAKSARNFVSTIEHCEGDRTSLLAIVNCIQSGRPADRDVIAPLIFAYGKALESRDALVLAADAYQTALYFTNDALEGDLPIESRMRLAYCRRMTGDLSGAEELYRDAERLAHWRRDLSPVRRVRLGLGLTAKMRGDLPAAEQLMEESAKLARKAGDTEVESLALQDRATVAASRGRMHDALSMSYRAMKLTTKDLAKEQLAGNLGVYFMELGRFDAARDAMLIQEATATIELTRIRARINLMSLAAREENYDAFVQYEAALVDAAMFPECKVDYLIERARGCLAFGSLAEAKALLERARNEASELGLHRAEFSAEAMLSTVLGHATPTVPPASVTRIEKNLRRIAAALT